MGEAMLKMIKTDYQKACALLRKGQPKAAQLKFEAVRQRDATYRSVNYFLAKCLYLNGAPKDQCIALLEAHLALKEAKNQKTAEQLLLKLDPLRLPPKKLRFKFVRWARNKTPIAQTSAKRFQKYRFFLNGLSEFQKEQFSQGKWQEFKIKTLKPLRFKDYLACTVADERTYYRKYLKDLPDAYLRTQFNDHLENDEFFKQRFERSKVFALLQVPGFKRQKIAELLALNGLSDETVQKHLQSCEDLIYLKKAGEVLPLSAKQNFADPQLLVAFGYLCPKECQQTLHLATKCQYEREFKVFLQKKTRKKLPFKAEKFAPTKEQTAFIEWLKQSKGAVVSLLGVGGSGKTYTLGKILDKEKALALAPTHKARLNLAANGFMHNDTLQHILYELEQGNETCLTDYDVVLVDEVSMATLEDLVHLTKEGVGSVRFILIGDEKQLPPVTQDEDALSVCGDALKLIKEYGQCFYFRKNLRCTVQATQELIAACRSCDLDYLAKTPYFKTARGKEMIIDKYQHQSLQECLILAYRNHTVGLINQQFFRILSKNETKVVPFYFQNNFGRGGFFVGAQVVFYHNDDSHQNYGYTNSEFGKIVGLELEGAFEQRFVYVETDVKQYKLPLERAIKDLLLAYALTIHKAQGSGAKRVYILEPENYGLAYTAVSRAKESIIFVGCEREQLMAGLQRPTLQKKNVSI